MKIGAGNCLWMMEILSETWQFQATLYSHDNRHKVIPHLCIPLTFSALVYDLMNPPNLPLIISEVHICLSCLLDRLIPVWAWLPVLFFFLHTAFYRFVYNWALFLSIPLIIICHSFVERPLQTWRRSCNSEYRTLYTEQKSRIQQRSSDKGRSGSAQDAETSAFNTS